MKIGCRQIDRILSRHVDGETTPSEGELIRKHLANCDACEERFRSYRRGSFLLQQFYDEVQAPDGMADAILARARQEREAPETVPAHSRPLLSGLRPHLRFEASPRIKRLGAVAAGLLIALVGQWLFHSESEAWNEGFISHARPPVMRQLPGAVTWSELDGSGFLLPGGSLQVLKDGFARIDFQGRGRLLVNSLSAIRLQNPTESGRVVILLPRGELFVEFGRNHAAFLLKTPGGEVFGRSAAANVRVVSHPLELGEASGGLRPYAGRVGNGLSLFALLPDACAASGAADVVVAVKTGFVDVRNGRGSARVFAGNQIRLSRDAPPGRRQPVNLGKALKWTRTQIASSARTEPRTGSASVDGAGPSASGAGLVAVKSGAGNTSGATAGTSASVTESAPTFRPDAVQTKPLKLFPPVILEATPQVGKICLKWVDDGATTYPVVGYEIYRITLDPETPPVRQNAEPIPVRTFDDGATGGTYADTSVIGDLRYTYFVKALASRASPAARTSEPGGSATPERTGLLESPSSSPAEARASRDYIIGLNGWTEKPERVAHIRIQKWHRGRYRGHVFHVRVGDSVGQPIEMRFIDEASGQPIRETVDFSTGATLVDIQPFSQEVSGGNHPTGGRSPLTLPRQKALLLEASGKITELVRRP